jgi:hypothetical protein
MNLKRKHLPNVKLSRNIGAHMGRVKGAGGKGVDEIGPQVNF